MPTVVKTIGSAGGRDFSTLAGWVASLPANLVTDGNSYEGDCFNDSEFTSASTLLTLSGHTTDSTHTITLTTGAGQSFRDNANAQTNALAYNQSNGVGIRCTSGYASVASVADAFVTISKLQFKDITSPGHGISASTANNLLFDGCIVEASDAATVGAIDMGGTGAKATNCVLIQRKASAAFIAQLGGGGKFVNCTLVVPSDVAAATAAVAGSYSTGSLENCAIFGATAVKSGSSTFTFTTCMTDVASPPTGCTTVTYASQFQNTTNASLDLRLKAGANCIDAGTTDTTDIPAAIDIVGTSRPQGSAWDIGAWELIAAAAQNPFSPFDYPNPRGPVFPQEDRSFINPSETQLIGKDQFFGAAGETKTFDYPNPRGYVFPAENRSFVNPAETQLIGKDQFFGAAGETKIYDWPVPRGAAYPIDNRTFLNAMEGQLFGKDKFFAAAGQAPVYHWPNPILRRDDAAQRPGWLGNLLQSTLGVIVFPFALFDWIVPRGPAIPSENRTFLNPAETQLIGKDQFFAAPGQGPAYDWPNPFRQRQSLPETGPSNLLSSLLALVAPFAQLLWLNPAGWLFPIIGRTHINPAQTQLIGQDRFFGAPGETSYYDWPVPKGSPHTNINRGHLDETRINLIGKDQFFAAPGMGPSYDWPNPGRRKDDVAQRGWLLSLLQSTLGIAALPFALFDWPNPLRRVDDPTQRSWLGNLLQSTLGIVTLPFAWFGWAVPRTQEPSVALRTHLDPLKRTLLGQDSFYGAPGEAPPNTDWPNPKGAQTNIHRGHAAPINLELLGQDRFFGAPGQPLVNPDLSPPKAAKAGVAHRGWVQGLNWFFGGQVAIRLNPKRILMAPGKIRELMASGKIRDLLSPGKKRGL